MLKFDDATTRLLEIAYQGGDVSRRRRMAFDALHLCDGESVIDIGCGNGLLTQEIARAVGATGQAIGIEPFTFCAVTHSSTNTDAVSSM